MWKHELCAHTHLCSRVYVLGTGQEGDVCTLTSLPANCVAFSSPRDFQATLEHKGLLGEREKRVNKDLPDPKESL